MVSWLHEQLVRLCDRELQSLLLVGSLIVLKTNIVFLIVYSSNGVLNVTLIDRATQRNHFIPAHDLCAANQIKSKASRHASRHFSRRGLAAIIFASSGRFGHGASFGCRSCCLQGVHLKSTQQRFSCQGNILLSQIFFLLS